MHLSLKVLVIGQASTRDADPEALAEAAPEEIEAQEGEGVVLVLVLALALVLMREEEWDHTLVLLHLQEERKETMTRVVEMVRVEVTTEVRNFEFGSENDRLWPVASNL